MEWYWVLLSGMIKFGIAFGPRSTKQNEFGLDSPGYWKEGQDVAAVGACRAMLATTPILMVLQTTGKSEALCLHGVMPFPLVVLCVALTLFGFFAFNVKAKWLKGTTTVLALAAILSVCEIAYTELGARDAAAKMLCTNYTDKAKS